MDHSPRIRRTALYIMSLVNFTNIMDVMIMMPLADLFIEEFSISPGEFSLLLSSYGVAAFFSSMFGVFLLDKFDRRNSLLFIYAGFILGTLLCGLVNTYPALLAIRFITGLFGGIIGALALSVVSDLYPFKERGRAIGLLMAAFSAAAALGVPTGFYLATQWGWRFPFLAIGGLGIILWILIFWLFPRIHNLEQAGVDYTPYELIRRIMGDRNVLMALLLGFIIVFGHFMIIPFITPYMTRNVGFEDFHVTLLYFIGGGFTVFTAPLIGYLTDRLGVIPVFFTIMLLSFIPVLMLTHLGEVSVGFGLMVTTLFFVLGSGRMLPPQSLITSAVGPDLRGSFMSLKSALQQLSIASAAGISGIIVVFDEHQHLMHYEWVGYLSVVICILAMLIAPRLKVASGN